MPIRAAQPESALMTKVTSTLLTPSAIPSLGGFDVDGKSDCTYDSRPSPGLSCVTASTLECVVCPQPNAMKDPNGVCGGILVGCDLALVRTDHQYMGRRPIVYGKGIMLTNIL